MGFRGKSFSAKSSPHEDLHGEKGQTTREVTKINHTLYVEQILKHFFFYYTAMASPTGQNGHKTFFMQSVKSKAHMWEMHSGWKELVSIVQPADRQSINPSCHALPSRVEWLDLKRHLGEGGMGY